MKSKIGDPEFEEHIEELVRFLAEKGPTSAFANDIFKELKPMDAPKGIVVNLQNKKNEI